MKSIRVESGTEQGFHPKRFCSKQTRLKDLSPELAKRKKYRKQRKQRNKKLDFKIKLI